MTNIYKMSNAGGMKSLTRYIDMLAGNPIYYPGPMNGYDSLATINVASSGIPTVTFAGIPTGYKTIELRSIARTTGNSDALVTFNGNSAVRRHILYGTGSGGANSTSATDGYVITTTGSTALAGNFGPNILQIIDYANTSKNKVIRSLGGNDNNGSGNIVFTSGLWTITDAINTISITAATGNWEIYSQFALYGEK